MTALSLDGGGAVTWMEPGRAADFSAMAGLAGRDPRDAELLIDAVCAFGPKHLAALPRIPESDLTPVGAPLEAAFVWPTGDMRVSMDPCPGVPAGARRAVCLAVTSSIRGLSRAHTTIVARASDWQVAGAPRYGAWLGLRPVQEPGGVRSIRPKLYLDVPAGAPWSQWEAELVGAPAVLPSRDVQLTMIGLDPVTCGVELYWRSARLYPGELDTLLRRLGLPERGGEIVDWIAALTQRRIQFELPAFDMGFSCAFDASGRACVFTWYANATAFLGPPARCREALLRVGAQRDWPMADYARFTEADAAGRVPEHGIIGASVAENAPLAATATVAVQAPMEINHAR